MVTWQTDRGSLGPSFLYHEHGKICLRLIVRQIVRLRLRVRLRRVHKALASWPQHQVCSQNLNIAWLQLFSKPETLGKLYYFE